MTVQRMPGQDPPEAEERQLAGWSGRLAFDVGANCGQSVGKLLGKYERVVALEPAAESYGVLSGSWGADERVTLLHVAVSETNEGVTLFAIPREMEMGQLVTWVGYEHTDAPVRRVPSLTVDTLARMYGVPDVVKVDTEGHEVHVLRGAAEVLRAGRTNWMIEFHNQQLYDDCVAILHGAGCRVEVVRHPHYEPGSGLWLGHGWIRGVSAAA